MSSTIVFVHANGYPAGTYRRLFAAWGSAGWRVLAPEKLGHDPRFPVVSNWRPTRDELVRFIERSGALIPVHLVGHSLGGQVALLVACRRPELVASVVLLDAPVIGRWRAGAIKLAKRLGLMERLQPAQAASRRTEHWPSTHGALGYFAAHPACANWEPAVLEDYVRSGTQALAGPESGVQLVFRREVESRFEATLPDQLARLLRRRPLRCPVGFVGGTDSRVLRRIGLGTTRRLTAGRFEWIEGSHLFPMERPLETAQAVLRLLPACA